MGVEVIKEENLGERDDTVVGEALFVFVGVYVGEYHAVRDRDLRFALREAVLVDQSAVTAETFHQVVDIPTRLFVRIGAGFFFEAEPDFEGFGIDLTDLVNRPVFHLENDQANIRVIEDKIRFRVVDVRRIPDDVSVIRLGDSA